MTNLNRRLRLDLASLLSTATDQIGDALGQGLAGSAGSGLRVQVTEIDITLPVRFEATAGNTLRVRLPSQLAPQPGHPGAIKIHIGPAAEGEG